MADIFITYKREDLARVEVIVSALVRRGYDVWLDKNRLEPGQRFRQVIPQELENCKAQLVCWSHLSAASDWVLQEADIGRVSNKLVPILLDQIKLPIPFAEIHAADLSGWQGESAHPEWVKLVSVLSVRSPPAVFDVDHLSVTIDLSEGTPKLIDGWNVSSLADTGAGEFTVTRAVTSENPNANTSENIRLTGAPKVIKVEW